LLITQINTISHKFTVFIFKKKNCLSYTQKNIFQRERKERKGEKKKEKKERKRKVNPYGPHLSLTCSANNSWAHLSVTVARRG